jgi:hypothetical protein
MGNVCTRCCGKVQDWCRDSCGCCPCRCCKTTNVELTLETTDHKIIQKKDTPYGYGRIYAGKMGEYIFDVFLTLQHQYGF